MLDQRCFDSSRDILIEIKSIIKKKLSQDKLIVHSDEQNSHNFVEGLNSFHVLKYI